MLPCLQRDDPKNRGIEVENWTVLMTELEGTNTLTPTMWIYMNHEQKP